MPIDLTGIGVGIQLDNETAIIPLTGTPGGGISDTVVVGSLGLSDNGFIYRKITLGAGAGTWEVIGSSGGSSWREPVLVKDDANYANLAAAELQVNTGTVDGVAVVDGSRLLFTDITGENQNIRIVSGTPGAGATLVEDAESLTIGDVVSVQEGTSADELFIFDGANWVNFDENILIELANIRTYIGKPAEGALTPDYTSEQVVTDGEDLTTAVSNLDAVANVPTNSPAIPAASLTTVASFLVDQYRGVRWDVSVIDTTNNRTEFITITATHNGLGGADATNFNGNQYGRTRIGGAISGLSYNLTLTGSGATQAVNLTFQANNICDVTVTRSGYTAAT